MALIEAIGNCPNCGAPIRGDECPYCGTAFTRKSEMPIYGKYTDIYDSDGNYITTLLANNLITTNEARSLLGLPPK